MKALLCLLFVTSTAAFAQDPGTYLKNFDNKVYSLKSKGVADFVVDIESSKLTKQMNDQQVFGKVKEVVFRTYWTAKPERLAIEVEGLPEGFKEVKEELKASLLGMMDNLLPPTMAQRFPNYKLSNGTNPKEILAQDTSGAAPIPSFVLKFDKDDKLTEVVGQRPIGTLVISPVYVKESFTDGRYVLKEQTTVSTEGGQTVTIKKELDYGNSQGIGVLTGVEVTTEQKGQSGKPVSSTEKLTFKNYKINTGDALKYFLGEGTKEIKKQ
ncbi:hypothetical protein ACJVC5_05965 [Peredibacter sp. HCB2-198]|uniref:hypothetical protein n=1 Tax=Peredibacter sp. HCB2-198 TaxID=3383025 RepID=UPI0038B58E71